MLTLHWNGGLRALAQGEGMQEAQGEARGPAEFVCMRGWSGHASSVAVNTVMGERSGHSASRFVPLSLLLGSSPVAAQPPACTNLADGLPARHAAA